MSKSNMLMIHYGFLEVVESGDISSDGFSQGWGRDNALVSQFDLQVWVCLSSARVKYSSLVERGTLKSGCHIF